jgi:hypothetical protein
MKQFITEAQRLQKLAGISELKILPPEAFEQNKILTILKNNGIDDEYFKGMGGKEIESGTEEWLGVLADVIGKNIYDDPNYDFSEEEGDKIQQFISKLSDMGIELI